MKGIFAKVLPSIITGVVLAIAAGIVDMRIALVRLEANISAMNARVERIERHIDGTESRYGMLDPD